MINIDVENYVGIGGEAPLLGINQVTYVPEKDLPNISNFNIKGRLKTVVFLQNSCIEGELYLINPKKDHSQHHQGYRDRPADKKF